MKYNITFGIKSLKRLIGCFCRLMLFAWDNEALFEIYYAKLRIHTPFNSNSYCMFSEEKNQWKKKMTPTLYPLFWGAWAGIADPGMSWENPLAFLTHAERGVRQSALGGFASNILSLEKVRWCWRVAPMRHKRRDHSCSEAKGKQQRWAVKGGHGGAWRIRGSQPAPAQPLGSGSCSRLGEERRRIMW